MKVVAIVPAGGSGARMKGDKKKQFLKLGDRPIIVHTLEKLAASELVSGIIVVVPADEIELCKKDVIEKYRIKKVIRVLEGGMTRHESVLNGFNALPKNTDVVLVHDGVRPLVTADMINDVIMEASKHGAATVAIRVKDTLKKVSDGVVVTGIPRDDVVRIQTPQAFQWIVLHKGLREADRDGFIATDESSLVERLGLPVHIVEGSEMNIKITTQDDLKMAEALLEFMK